jgi:hypothetical protein
MTLRRILSGFMIFLVVCSYSLVRAQTGDPTVDAAYKTAVQALTKKLGKPIPGVDNYSYSLESYPDAGLGCPDPGQTFPAAKTQAYKFLITVKGITYDVRVTTDAARGVVCANSAIKQSISLSTYRNAQFTINYPETWGIVNRTTDVFFGLGAIPVCAQPGILVTPLGQVAADKTTDALIEDYLATNTSPKPLADRFLVGNVGRGLLFTAPCTDGSLRETMVVVFIFFGRAYRIAAFAPQTAYDQWSDVFQKVVISFSPGITSQSNATNGQAVQAIAQAPKAYVAHIFAGNVYIATLDDLPGAPVTTDAVGDHRYSRIAFARNGDSLVFLETTNEGVWLDTASVGHTGKRLIQSTPAAEIQPQFAPVWSPDAKQIAYVFQTDQKVYQLAIVTPVGALVSQTALPDQTVADCKEDMADPANITYYGDTALCGNPGLILWLADGSILVSSPSGVGVWHFTPGGTDKPVQVSPTLRHVKLSPDGKQLIGVRDDPATLGTTQLSIVTIADGTIKDIPVAASPLATAWNTNGAAVFYSTATVKQTLKVDDAAQSDRAKTQLGVFPFQTTVYSLTLHRIDIRTNDDSILVQIDGRAIDHVVPSPDGTGVLYTVVTDASSVVSAFNNNTSPSDLHRQYPTVQLYWLALAGGTPQLAAVTNDPIWGPILP